MTESEELFWGIVLGLLLIFMAAGGIHCPKADEPVTHYSIEAVDSLP